MIFVRLEWITYVKCLTRCPEHRRIMQVKLKYLMTQRRSVVRFCSWCPAGNPFRAQEQCLLPHTEGLRSSRVWNNLLGI